jgi:ketoreductase
MQEKAKLPVALVTGASRGIGLCISNKLANDGFLVAMLGRDETTLRDAVGQLTAAGLSAYAVLCDVRDPKMIELAMDTVVKRHGPISVLVNNAGRSGGARTCEMDIEMWRDIVDTNLNSCFYVTRSVLRDGRLQRPGAILNIASTGGKQGVIYAAAYSASKHGVVGFTKSLALELAKDNITVNAVCPGFVETTLAEKVRRGYAEAWGVTPAEAKTRIVQRIPLGRYIEPEEVASLVGFLASSSARGITGQAYNVCGGLGNY